MIQLLRRSLPAALLLLAAVPAFAQAAPSLEGHWEGVIQVRPHEFEVGLQLDVTRGEEGLQGLLTVPLQRVAKQPVEALRVAGRDVSFRFEDATGESLFSGRLDEEGRRITGELQESGQTFRFELARAAAPTAAPEPELVELEPGAAAFVERFNADRDKTRLLVVLAPTCFQCRVATGMLQRNLLEAVDDEDLRVYIVWESILDKDTVAAARDSATLAPHPRATHFWSTDRTVGRALSATLGLTDPAWDVFLLYPAGATWGETAPKPGFYQHKAPGLPEELRFDTEELADAVRRYLWTDARPGLGAARTGLTGGDDCACEPEAEGGGG